MRQPEVYSAILQQFQQEAIDPYKGGQMEEKIVSRFTGLAGQLLKMYLTTPPVETPEEIIEEEGSIGILPSPAKRLAVRSKLRSEPIPPLRIRQEVIQGKPEHVLDNLAIFVISDLNPQTCASYGRMSAIAASLKLTEALCQSIKAEGFFPQFEFEDGLPLRVKKILALLLVTQRNISGQYLPVSKSDLNSSQSVQKALEGVKSTLGEFSSKATPEAAAFDDFVAFQMNIEAIKKEILDLRKKGVMVLPILAAPTAINYRTGGWYETTLSLNQLAKDFPMMMVNPDGTMQTLGPEKYKDEIIPGFVEDWSD